MPPVNDDFANATVLNPAGGTLQGDNTGATSEGANDYLVTTWGAGIHTVWYKLASSGLDREITIGTDAPTSGTPLTDSVIAVLKGTTLAGLTVIASDDDSGPGFYSQLTSIALPAGQTIYIEVSGYDNTYEGGFTLTWSLVDIIPPPQTVWCIDAITDPNSGSSTITVLGDAVREKQITGGYVTDSQTSPGDATPAFYVRNANLPPAGIYTATVKYRRNVSNQTWTVFLKRNGLVLGPVNTNGITCTATPTVAPLTGETVLKSGPATVPILAGDTIEVCAIMDTDAVPNGIEILQVCFTIADSGGAAGTPLYPLTLAEPRTPLGGSSYHSDFNGVYKFPRAKAMTIMPNGHIYVFTVSTGTTSNYYKVMLHRWNGSAWSTLSSDVWGLGNPGPQFQEANGASITNDGTDVFMACGYRDTPSSSTWKWHCWKWNVAGSSLSELGTGQGYYSPVSTTHSIRTTFVRPGSYHEGSIVVGKTAGSDLWALWSERNPESNYLISDFTGGAANLTSGTDGFNLLTATGSPASRDGSGNCVGTAAGESGSYCTIQFGEEVAISTASNSYLEEVGVFEVSAAPTGTDWIGWEYRLSGQGTDTRNGYRVIWEGAGSGAVKWQKIVAGVPTTIKNWGNVFGVPSVGDILCVIPAQNSGFNSVDVYRYSGGSWTSTTSSGYDATYTINTDKAAISFSGTSGKITTLRGGDTTQDIRPCAFYWNGASWVDSGLPLIPGGVRRNYGGQQTMGVTNIGMNESWMDLTFCQHDGPNVYPSILYSTTHGIPTLPAYPGSSRFHYYEWNGATWDNYVMQSSWDIFGTAMYRSTLGSPNYYESDGYPEGFKLFHDGTTPWFVGNIRLYTPGDTDLVGAAKMTTGGTGFFAEAIGNPDDVIRIGPDTNSQGPFTFRSGSYAAIDSRKQIFVWSTRYGGSLSYGHILMRHPTGADVGTGSQWVYGSKLNTNLGVRDHNGHDVIAVDVNDNVYILTDEGSSAIFGSYVYKYTQPNTPWYGRLAGIIGTISMRYRGRS